MHDIVHRRLIQSYVIVPVFLGLVGCAGTAETPDARDDIDPVFSMETVERVAAPASVERVAAAESPVQQEGDGDAPMSVRDAPAFHIQARFVRPGDEVLTAPAISVYAGQRANVTVINQTAYVETIAVEVVDDAWIADPIIGILQDGIVLDMCVDAQGDDAVLAYRATVSDLATPLPQRSIQLFPDSTPITVQMPKIESSEVAGMRQIVPGVTTRLATFAARSGAVELHVRVTPAEIVFPEFVDRTAETFLGVDPSEVEDFEAPGGEAFALSEWTDVRGEDLRIDVEALVLDGESGGLSDARRLRKMTMTSRAVPGASMRASLDEAYVADYEPVRGPDRAVVQPHVETLRSGISATIGDDGDLRLTWATAPRWGVATLPRHLDAPLDQPRRQVRSASLALIPGHWLVRLGRTPDGDTLALGVRVTLEPARRGAQRRVATQTQATMKRRPPASSAR